MSPKREIIEECVKSICSMECLHHSVRGNELWSVWEKKDGTRVIVLFLLSKKDGCWKFKEVAESYGPNYYKCPIGFLEMAAVANKEWRDKVYAYQESRINNLRALKRIKIGMIVALDVPDNEFRVTHLKPFEGVSLKNRKQYHLVKTRVVGIREATPKLQYPTSVEQSLVNIGMVL